MNIRTRPRKRSHGAQHETPWETRQMIAGLEQAAACGGLDLEERGVVHEGQVLELGLHGEVLHSDARPAGPDGDLPHGAVGARAQVAHDAAVAAPAAGPGARWQGRGADGAQTWGHTVGGEGVWLGESACLWGLIGVRCPRRGKAASTARPPPWRKRRPTVQARTAPRTACLWGAVRRTQRTRRRGSHWGRHGRSRCL